jgi:hypothetical protein
MVSFDMSSRAFFNWVEELKVKNVRKMSAGEFDELIMPFHCS